MKIPILNLYYLVSYASGILSHDPRQIPVGDDDGYDLSELYARLLINGVDGLLRRGLHRQYVEQEEEIMGIKGQLRLGESVTRNSFRSGRAVCQFDELDVDILPNRILKSAMRRVLASPTLNKDLAGGLRSALRRLQAVRDVPLSLAMFRPLVMHRNMSRYRFLLFISRLVADQSEISEDGGTASFIDLERDEKKLARLFEAFVRNFYAREVPDFRKGRTELSWSFEMNSESHLLPGMKTDVPLESDDRIVIIDTKYYATALVSNAYDVEKLRSGHIFQMFAYMRHYPNPEQVPVTGILLYPRVDRDLDIAGVSRVFPTEDIRFKTIDLYLPWRNIHEDLIALLTR